MSVMFITSEKENFKVCTTGGAKIRSQNKLTSLFMVRFSKKFGYPTFYYLLVCLFVCLFVGRDLATSDRPSIATYDPIF